MIAPLDWGLGHATRCVPVIRQLMQHNQLLLGVTPLTKPVFDQEFPALQQVELPPYGVSYAAHTPLWLRLLFDSGRIKRVIGEEHRLLSDIIKKHHIDVVISDNRFGLYHEAVYTVFITHQLFIKAPVFAGIANRVNRRYIKQFNEVWVPDFKDVANSLSGGLSHGKPFFHPNVKYIGPQSRLQNINIESTRKRYDYLVLLSGPEPQRTLLENILLEKFAGSTKSVALVRGTQQPLVQAAGAVDVFDFPGAVRLVQLIMSAETVICRSGYSTLMDMHALGKKSLLLVPTPGQTEQEYLARYWQKNFGTLFAKQSELKHNSF